MERKVYLDSASTTYVNSEVLQEMLPMFNSNFGNSNSLHFMGREAINKVDEARIKVAKAINCKANEIYFTSGGTEANNWAIKGLAYANKDKGNHIITSKIEHHSVLDACKELENEGFVVTYLNVDETGMVKLNELMENLTDNTILVSIMSANNEVGTIQYLKAIAQTCKEKENVVFHTDAVQAFSHMKLDVNEIGIDSLTISSHKIYGPKGAGALYVKKGVKINSLIVGGNQERGKRGGTLNTPCIVGFGKAVELITRDMHSINTKLKTLRDYLQNEIQTKISNVHFNGHLHQRLPNILSLSFEGVDNESLLTMLDMEGICVGLGSACTSGVVEPSFVLKAMGLSTELSKGTIRFSLSKANSKEDIDYVVNKLITIVERLREISPIKLIGGKK